MALIRPKRSVLAALLRKAEKHHKTRIGSLKW
jgi:hypothetical protein